MRDNHEDSGTNQVRVHVDRLIIHIYQTVQGYADGNRHGYILSCQWYLNVITDPWLTYTRTVYTRCLYARLGVL